MVPFAGLWERGESDGEPMESFTLLITAAPSALADVHHRQPAIIEARDFDAGPAPDTLAERLLALARWVYEGRKRPDG